MWGWLALAVVAEVTGTLSLKASDGLSRLVPSVITLVGYGVAFWALSQTLTRGMSLGVAYGVWAASGVALVALAGAAFLGEGLTWIQAGGIVLVMVGVLALEMGGATSHA